jgi:SnoaL-like domain
MSDLEDRIARLEAIEEIRRLKARYFRCVDTKAWDEFAELFTDDVVIEFAESTSGARTKAEFVAAARRHFIDAVSVHHGHEPEIEILDDTHATGVWPMYDLVEVPTYSAYVSHTGWGHYIESYRREADGAWRISASRLTRLKRVEL